MQSQKRTWLQASILLLVWGGYGVLFLALYPQVGAGLAALAILPVVAMAVQAGVRGGLLAGVISFPVNTLLLNLVGYQPGGWDVVIRGGGGPGTLVLVLIGVMVGRLQDLTREVQQQLKERLQAEAELRKITEQLEIRVAERTAALSESNERLQLELRERERIEQAMRESEERYRSLVEASADAIVVTDLNTNIRLVNPTTLRLLGYTSSEELIGKNALDLIAPEDRPRAIQNALKTLQTGSVRDVEYRLLKTDNSPLSVELSASLIVDGEDKPLAFTAIIRDITERKRAQEEFHYLSTHDALTGLYNRAFFEAELARLEGGRQFPVSLVIADVDHLKAVNDEKGHAAGDEALRRAAELLERAHRTEDVVARIGGDEFAILLPATDRMAADKVLARIKETLAAFNTVAEAVSVSLSLGSATATRGEKLVEVLKQADAAMYQDKLARQGRSRD